MMAGGTVFSRRYSAIFRPHGPLYLRRLQFEEWPVRSDAVVLARVLHDWPDDEAFRILSRARESMLEGGTLYVVEMVLDTVSGTGGLLDLNMLVVAGAAERTEEQFISLLDETGFELRDVTPTRSVSSVIRARAV